MMITNSFQPKIYIKYIKASGKSKANRNVRSTETKHLIYTAGLI